MSAPTSTTAAMVPVATMATLFDEGELSEAPEVSVEESELDVWDGGT
jgi:hypothetical protein